MRAVGALDPVAAGQRIAPAREARSARCGGGWRGCSRASARGSGRRGSTPSPPAMRALAARAAADREPLQPHREPRLQNLGIGQAAVGHVGLHRARPVMVGTGARSAGDRLVILVARIAEGEIVHRPLARRQPAGRGEQARR